LKKNTSTYVKAITMALFATIIIQLWVALPVGSNTDTHTHNTLSSVDIGDNTATATHTNTTWEFVNTTTESTTPLEGVTIPEHIISTWEENWEIPGTPVNETITLLFVFQLNSSSQENTPVLFFGNINIMVWFLGYEYDNTMKNATPYQSETIIFNTEEALQKTSISDYFTNTIIDDSRCVYNYTGTIRHLFETYGENINATFITITKMYYISDINRPPESIESNKCFETGVWDTKERVWADEEAGTWWYEKDIRNYYKLYTKKIPRTTLYGNEKQTKYFLSTIPEGAAHRKQVKHWYDNNYDDPYTGGYVNMYSSTFQIYVLPGTQNTQVNVTIGTDTNYEDITPKGKKYFFITNNMNTKFNTVTDSVTGDIRHIFEKGDGNIVKDQTFIYNFNSSLVDWNYITVFTTLPSTYVIITVNYDGVQNTKNITDAIRMFDILSLDNIWKRWYTQTLPGNTTITHNITKTSQTYTLWDNKTRTHHFFNNTMGSSNITYNNITCINGTWIPSTENITINTDLFVVNPENTDGTNPDKWFLKYTYTIYNRTVVETEKTINYFSFTYNYTHTAVFDYTEQMKNPIEFEIDTLEGKLTPCVDSNMLVYYPELLMISQNYFDNWNKKTELGFIQPDLNKTTCQGRYLKNVWMVILPNPVVYGQYVWVPQEGKINQYYHYEVLIPWSLYHNYTYRVWVNSNLIAATDTPAPSVFEYDPADKNYYYTVTNDQINNDDFQFFNITMSLRIQVAVYKDGDSIAFDYEDYLIEQKTRLDVHKITPDRIKIYLKEDIWEKQDTYQQSLYPMTYKIYTITPDNYNYNETGENTYDFTSQGYPYLGFLFRCSNQQLYNMSSSAVSNVNISSVNLSGLISEIENITGEDIPDELLNATVYINMPQYLNTSFTLYTLDANKVFPAYQQYGYILSPSILIAAGGMSPIDEAAFERMKDEMQNALGSNATNSTGNITLSIIQSLMPTDTSEYLQSSLVSMNTTMTIVKINTQKIMETSIVGFFDITKIDDTTNISFRGKDSWTTTEINNLLDTNNWLTYVEPMKTQLIVDIDKEKPEKNENVNVTIKLLIGNNGKATIDGEYAAANQSVAVTYPDQSGNIITETRYTNDTGFIIMNFTAPGKEFVFKVDFDTTKLHIGSASFSKKIGAMSLWDFIQGLMGPLILTGIFLIIIMVTYDSVRRVIWGKNRPWRILK